MKSVYYFIIYTNLKDKWFKINATEHDMKVRLKAMRVIVIILRRSIVDVRMHETFGPKLRAPSSKRYKNSLQSLISIKFTVLFKNVFDIRSIFEWNFI